MRALATVRAIAAVAAAALVPFTFQGSASATATGAHQSHKVRYCLTEVARINPSEPTTSIIGRICSDRHDPGSTLPAGTDMRQETLLVTFYQNVDYGGLFDSISSQNGGCNAAGYSLPDLKGIGGGITSYQLFNRCDFATYWTGVGFTGRKHTHKGNDPNVGAPWAGHLYSMRIWA